MANKEAKYDKVLLTLAAIAALGVSGTLYFLKTSFPEKLVQPRTTPKTDFGLIPVEEVSAAIKNLQQPFEWTAPIRQNKPVPLNKSVTVVMKGGELFDMYVENPPLRPPMTNKYLRENELEYLSPNVGDLDPDGDGFTNLEEFNKGTKPNDPKSHPPVTDHLYFKERVQNNYILVLQSSTMPLQVKRTEPLPAGSVFVDAVPKPFGFERNTPTQRFVAEKFEKKEFNQKDVSELTVLDTATNLRVVLPYKEPKNLAEYQVSLEFRDKTVQILKDIKKGENFRLANVGSTFKVLEIGEDNATVAELDSTGKPGKTFVVPKRP